MAWAHNAVVIIVATSNIAQHALQTSLLRTLHGSINEVSLYCASTINLLNYSICNVGLPHCFVSHVYILQVYVKLMELKMMQLNKYNFKSLHHVQQILKKVQLEELSNVILTVQSSY